MENDTINGCWVMVWNDFFFLDSVRIKKRRLYECKEVLNCYTRNMKPVILLTISEYY
jgi:hypothetical protein